MGFNGFLMSFQRFYGLGFLAFRFFGVWVVLRV